MKIRFKVQNAIAVYVLFLLLTYLWKGTIPLTDFLTGALEVGVLFYLLSRYIGPNSTMSNPLARAACYFVMSFVAIGIGVLSFVFHLFSMSVYQYGGFIVATATAYYFVDSAFDKELVD